MKIKRFSEASFLLGAILLGFATSMMSKAGFGLSMVVAPCYVLADKLQIVSTGTMCYLFQGALIIVTSIIMGKFRFTYLFSFLSAVIFGLAVDFFDAVIFDHIQTPELWQRILLYAVAIPINSLSITLLLRSYFPPQAPELFVKELSRKNSWQIHKTKYVYDLTSCAVSILLSLLFFRQLRFIGVGTVICAFINAPLIGFYGRFFDKFIDFSALFPRIEKIFK